MLMAARKLQGIGLVLLVLIFAMMLYPVSLKVAATRSELTRIERDIVQARDNIRYLESELAVRASMRQLEQWNADTFGYSAPDASQYLENERQLARSEEHTSELQSLMRISYAVFCLKKKIVHQTQQYSYFLPKIKRPHHQPQVLKTSPIPKNITGFNNTTPA